MKQKTEPKIEFTGKGRYKLRDGQSSIELGQCDTEPLLIAAVMDECRRNGPKNWRQWTARQVGLTMTEG